MKAKIETLVTEYSGYKVGVDGVLEIKSRPPKTDGAQWFYDVIYKDGFIREFMPVRVRYKNYDDKEYPEPKFYENLTANRLTGKDEPISGGECLMQEEFEQRLVNLMPKGLFYRKTWNYNPENTFYYNVEDKDYVFPLGCYTDMLNWTIFFENFGRERFGHQ